jgi:hypothetical protein
LLVAFLSQGLDEITVLCEAFALQFGETTTLSRLAEELRAAIKRNGAEGTSADVAAFMTGYLDNYTGGASGRWVQRLLETLAEPDQAEA